MIALRYAGSSRLWPLFTGAAVVLAATGPVAACSGTDQLAPDATISVARSVLGAGAGHVCFLPGDGRTICWGQNGAGQLGDGTGATPDAPVQVAGGLTFVSVTTGAQHSCGLTADGAAYCWGEGRFGRLGDGTENTSTAPVPVAGGLKFASLSAGDEHTCGVTLDSLAYCWGNGDAGQLGGIASAQCTVYAADPVQPYPVSFPCSRLPLAVAEGLRWLQVAAGKQHSCGLSTDGTTYCWGRASALGGATATERCVLDPYVASYGPCSTTPSPLATPGRLTALAAGSATCGLAGSGGVVCWGADAPTSVGGSGIVALSVGDGHACGLDAQGDALCWGSNDHGQLGTGDTTARSAPSLVQGDIAFQAIAAGTGFSCGSTDAGAAYCWGDNSLGALGAGTGPALGIHWVPTPVAATDAFAVVAAGRVHTCALSASGTAYCWGGGSVGLGDWTPQPVTASRTFVSLTSGWDHACALDADSLAYCWGSNDYGQLGTGGASTTAPVAVAGAHRLVVLVAGLFHTCGIDAAGAAWCWGANERGELGIGSTTNAATPTAVAGNYSFQRLAAGSVHTCGITSAGETLCWGDNGYGQIGTGGSNGSTVPVRVAPDPGLVSLAAGTNASCGLDGAGTVYCWGQLYTSSPQVVAAPVPFVRVSVGDMHSCAVTAAGVAYCWGQNQFGQIGDVSHESSCCFSGVSAVSGQLHVARISAGYHHTCAITADSKAYCWGENAFGQLGLMRESWGPSLVVAIP